MKNRDGSGFSRLPKIAPVPDFIEHSETQAREDRPATARRLGAVTLDMYDRMIAADLHMMSPIGDRHADAVNWLARWSQLAIGSAVWLVRVQNPLAIPGSESAPQPDLAWVKLRRYADRRPLPEDVSLVIEVVDTSLDFDTTVKAGLYAAAGIADYWVIDLVSRGVIVFRDPRSGAYETRSTHRGDEFVSPLALPSAALSPAELFGKSGTGAVFHGHRKSLPSRISRKWASGRCLSANRAGVPVLATCSPRVEVTLASVRQARLRRRLTR